MRARRIRSAPAQERGKQLARLLLFILLLASCPGCGTRGGRPKAVPAQRAPSAWSRAKEAVIQVAPDGKIRSVRLTRDNGRWVWKVKIARPAAHELVKVWISARTGEVLAVKKKKQKR